VFLGASPSVSGLAILLHELWRRKQRQISLHEYKFCVLKLLRFETELYIFILTEEREWLR
jgi:hypothetical protein